jgi:DNA-binding PadR family transcriptional regulator
VTRSLRLTPRQHHVLSVLFTRGPAARNDWAAWFPLTTSQVYGIIDALGRRGLVDAHSFSGNSRLFAITEAGRAALEGYDGEKIEEDE